MARANNNHPKLTIMAIYTLFIQSPGDSKLTAPHDEQSQTSSACRLFNKLIVQAVGK